MFHVAHKELGCFSRMLHAWTLHAWTLHAWTLHACYLCMFPVEEGFEGIGFIMQNIVGRKAAQVYNGCGRYGRV